MNPTIKLIFAFAAGVVVTVLIISFTNTAESPSSVANIQDETDANSVGPVTDTTTPVTETPGVETQPSVSTQNSQPAPTPTYVPPSTPSVSYPYAATVSFTGSRFIPQEALIVKGGNVTFRNDSGDQDMWIASNFHPTHAAYPGKAAGDCAGSSFDQCVSVGPGQTWTYTFNENGNWFYHEENRPVINAEVRVYTKERYREEF